MTKTYKQLLDESPQYLICAYGKTGHVALGFRGSKEVIEKAWYLFINFDKTMTLHWVSYDLAYIITTKERIFNAIKLFLYVNILLSHEVESDNIWDEENGIFELVQDVNLVTELSIQDARSFVDSLPVESFIPCDKSSDISAYDYAAAA